MTKHLNLKSLKVTCSSSIKRVVLHARGALVTREVVLPEDLGDGIVDVEVEGITLHAQAGSVRAALEESNREVLAVHAGVSIPSGPTVVGPTLTVVRELSAKIQRIADEHRVLMERRGRLLELSPNPRIRVFDGRQRERDALDARFEEALAMTDLVDDTVKDLDERIAKLESEKRTLTKALAVAKLDDLQSSSSDRETTESRTITTRLLGSGKGGRLLVTYAVGAARWWPTYTLRVAGDAATWTFEAIVAQKTDEDWSGVALSLSSADLIYDARLPELTSIRFGRAQPPVRPAFRPAPVGVDDMFAAYTAFGVHAFRIDRPPPKAAPAPHRPPVLDHGEIDDEDTAVNRPSVDAMMAGQAMPRPASNRLAAAAPPARSRRAGGAPPPPPAAMPMSMPMSEMGAAPPQAPGGMMGMLRQQEVGGGGGPMMDGYGYAGDYLEEPAEPELVVGEAWNDFDQLILASADDGRRGRLIPRGGSAGENTRHLQKASASVDAAVGAPYQDPFDSRGMFDHRYEAAARADVPSDGRPHRVTVGAESCPVRMAWRAVPSESAEVYREAHVANPWPTALLGGPVDVYLDGSLLTTARIDRIDRGGTFFCGMGVDDRLKIARNIRVAEESAGLLGGSLAVTHTVDIELTSTVRDPVIVTVLERVPVSDDKALEVKLVRATPLPDVYDQADRGAPIRGGCRFTVTVHPSKKTSVEVIYKLLFAQKLDIVGGSRRG